MSPDIYPVGFRLYRKLQRGEFFVCFGDTAQGGSDKNFTQFMSKDHMDIPLVFSMHGVAAEMTPHIHQALEWIYQQTGVKPVFAFERQNGGVSEMHNLMKLNKGSYRLYVMKGNQTIEGQEDSDRYGWDTNSVTRPAMLGDWKVAYETGLIRMYDQETLDHHQTFIVNPRNGKPEADSNQHDDGVMSCAGAYQLYQTENKMLDDMDEIEQYKPMTAFSL